MDGGASSSTSAPSKFSKLRTIKKRTTTHGTTHHVPQPTTLNTNGKLNNNEQQRRTTNNEQQNEERPPWCRINHLTILHDDKPRLFARFVLRRGVSTKPFVQSVVDDLLWQRCQNVVKRRALQLRFASSGGVRPHGGTVESE